LNNLLLLRFSTRGSQCRYCLPPRYTLCSSLPSCDTNVPRFTFNNMLPDTAALNEQHCRWFVWFRFTHSPACRHPPRSQRPFRLVWLTLLSRTVLPPHPFPVPPSVPAVARACLTHYAPRLPTGWFLGFCALPAATTDAFYPPKRDSANPYSTRTLYCTTLHHSCTTIAPRGTVSGSARLVLTTFCALPFCVRAPVFHADHFNTCCSRLRAVLTDTLSPLRGFAADSSQRMDCTGSFCALNTHSAISCLCTAFGYAVGSATRFSRHSPLLLAVIGSNADGFPCLPAHRGAFTAVPCAGPAALLFCYLDPKQFLPYPPQFNV